MRGIIISGNHGVTFIDTEEKPQTNADRIRAMTDEELANFIESIEVQGYDLHGTFGADYWLDWLKQEAKE